MPDRPDLRKISGTIRDALADCDRDTLLDMLTFVFKEYLVEGPPPLLVSQTERLPDLEGLSFAQLVTTLQTRLDHPELGLFHVEGEQVSVRVNGALTPLGAPPRIDAELPAGQPAPPQPRQAPGVRVVETDIARMPASTRSTVDEAMSRGRGDLAGVPPNQASRTAQPAERTAPPPVRGLSVRGVGAGAMMPSGGGAGRDAGDEPAAPPQAAQPPARPPQQPPAQPPARPPQGEPGGAPSSEQDIASTRFSLLELD